jgi:hypothetical protein
MERPNATLNRASLSLEELKDQLQGNAFRPDEEGYDEARFSWNLSVDHRPAVVVVADSVQDVQLAVRYASQNNLQIAIQATGHGQPRTCHGGVLIRTGNLDSVSIDARARTAKVGAGCKWADVIGPAQELGLAPLSGSAPHVGVVGYTLGGGYGLMVRKYGLAVDSVRSIQIVTADAEVVTASQDENSDLFWALLGGGGAFGVVTEMEIELYPHPFVYGGAVIYPIELAPQVYARYAEWTPTLPDEVTSSIAMMNIPPLPFVPEPLRGQCVVLVTGCVAADEATGEALMKPMREIGHPIMEMFGNLPYTMSGMIHQDPVDPLPAGGQGVLLRDLDQEALKTLVEATGPMSQSPNLKIEIRHLGGAMSRVAHEATSIGCRRDAQYLLYVLGVPTPGNEPERMDAHAKSIFRALEPWVICRGPLNFLGEASVPADAIRKLFSQSDYERLLAVKRNLDPQNLFAYSSLGIAQAALG